MIIDVWSDVVCPWCYIGRRRLQRALADFLHREDITVRHRAFQLQPDITSPILTSEHLADKYNIGPSQIKEMQANVCTIAAGEGLCYDLDQSLSGNTLDAHRLLLWAEEIGMQEVLLEGMYAGYFEEGKPLFSHEDLLAITDQVGIDRIKAEDLLDSGNFLDRVLEDGELAQRLGATGVPFYVVDMKYGITGAQPVEAFTQTIETAWKERI
jgi:predicted DsbA family dithiol-disulfide isomerase